MEIGSAISAERSRSLDAMRQAAIKARVSRSRREWRSDERRIPSWAASDKAQKA
jgi:hypothetical protein